jgi:hypothetical protein
MKQVVELVEGLRYKLYTGTMGIEVDGPTTNVFCDNEAVLVSNTTCPESTLEKKHNAITYHMAHAAQSTGIIHVAKEEGATNLADLFTELLPGPLRAELAGKVLW